MINEEHKERMTEIKLPQRYSNQPHQTNIKMNLVCQALK